MPKELTTALDGSLLCPHCYEPITLPSVCLPCKQRSPVVEPVPAFTHTAYLVAVFKLAGEPQIPTFVGVGIFSEPEPTMGGDRRCWMVWKEDDVTYTDAKRHLLAVIRSSPELAWAAPHLRERDLL